jgi:hypothetical protein
LLRAHDHPLARTGVHSRMRAHARGKRSNARFAVALVACLCAAFALGDAISKACPPGFSRLDDVGACEIAATAANRTYAGVKALSYYAFGCYWHPFTDRVYYNDYSGNIENETYSQPLCAGAAGNPTQARSHSGTVSARARELDRTRRRQCGHADAHPSTCTHKQTDART